MADMYAFSDDNFTTEVLQSPTPVLVDFTAVWCGPCKMIAPIVASLNDEWNGAVKVGKLDVDENVNTAMQFGVMGVPTLILFKNGRPVERVQGYMPKEKIQARLKPHL